MAVTLLWVGMTFMLAVPEVFPSFRLAKLIGAILMLVGSILLFFKE